jgi:alkyl sulfatase BDS1-like metallo-beta-lactamase superfamily hydrolase
LQDGNFGTAAQVASLSLLSQLMPEQILDGLAVSVNGPRAWHLDLAVDMVFADLDINYRITLRNGVLVYRNVPADPATADATVQLAGKVRLLAAAMGDLSSPGLTVAGDEAALQALLGALDRPDPAFNIVTP